MNTLLSSSTLQNGKYEIQRVLGQGGFGITYLATQHGLNRIVAIKEFFMERFCLRNADTCHVTIADDGSRELVNRYRNKFLKEARNIAKLEHPNIVSIIDVFEENSTAYYVMKYAQNGSLDDKVQRKGHLSEAEATRYILKVADALHFVHQHKMTHLDVKPANILLSEKDEPWLIDFGLSKQYDAQAGKQTSCTPLGFSPGYAPIEQYMADGTDSFSPESDIYSLGATFYKLLTGNTPPDAPFLANNGLPVQELKAKNVSQQSIYLIFQAMEPLRKDRLHDMNRFIELLMEITIPENPKKEYRALVKKDGKFGFIDKNGTLVVPCIYDSADEYWEGMACIEMDGKWGFIDKNGTMIVPCIYEKAFPYHEGMACVKKDGKWGFIDKNRTLVVPCIYDDAYGYWEGMVRVKKDGKWGFIDKNGTLVVPCIYDSAYEYHEGLACIEMDGKWGFIDKNGTLVVPCIYEKAFPYSEGLAQVEKEGKWGFIDKNGTIVVPCIYGFAYNYYEGLAAVANDNQWGFIDKSGTLVVPCIYDEVKYYSEGLASVTEDHKFGFINKNGTLVVPCIYDSAYDYCEGLAEVEKDGKRGFIDKNGTLVVPCIYDSTDEYCEGMTYVEMDGKYGFIDKNGTLVVPCIYDYASNFRAV